MSITWKDTDRSVVLGLRNAAGINVGGKRVVNVNEWLRPPTYFYNSLCLTTNNSTNYS